MKTKRAPRYGIPYHTIKYWQDQAKMLYRYNGIYAGRQFIEASFSRYGQPVVSGREIGHNIISLAAVASPEHLKAVLAGTRGRRWS
jgi:hypothetical protein